MIYCDCMWLYFKVYLYRSCTWKCDLTRCIVTELQFENTYVWSVWLFAKFIHFSRHTLNYIPERRTFRFGLSSSGSAPRLSERRTFIFGLTSMSFVSTLASRFLRYFWQRSDICAILFQSDILEQIVFIPSGFEQTSRQRFFL